MLSRQTCKQRGIELKDEKFLEDDDQVELTPEEMQDFRKRQQEYYENMTQADLAAANDEELLSEEEI